MARLSHALEVLGVNKELEIASMGLDMVNYISPGGVWPSVVMRALTPRGSGKLISPKPLPALLLHPPTGSAAGGTVVH